MSTTPHVWKLTRHGSPGPNMIAIGHRIFDGIETEYDRVFAVTPDEARYIATELWKFAESIDGKLEKTSKLKDIRENTSKIAAGAKKEAMA